MGLCLSMLLDVIGGTGNKHEYYYNKPLWSSILNFLFSFIDAGTFFVTISIFRHYFYWSHLIRMSRLFRI